MYMICICSLGGWQILSHICHLYNFIQRDGRHVQGFVTTDVSAEAAQDAQAGQAIQALIDN